MPTPIDQLNIEITSDATSAEASLSKLATTLGTLKSACSGGLGLNTVTTNLRTLSTAVNSISSTDNLRKLADALRDIGSASASTGSLSSIAKQLGSIPKSLTDLGKIDLNAFKDSIKSISDALDPLITKLNSLASNTGAITALQQLARMGGSSGSGSSGGSRGGLFGSLLTAGAGAASIHHITGMIQGLSKPLAECIEKANSYVEALNLFTVALGSYASRAQEYAEYVSAKVGIDPADWLKAEGTFMTLIEGFGVMEDRAYTMSQNLTQLGYDLASFFNISVQDAMTKVQSGISGELEPLRRLGFDLSQTRLKAEALALGITESFNNMTQAEKAQLRYHAIMTQVTTAQGDMARTINSSANQIRILQAQLTQCGRAIGQIFIPILNAIIPVAIAVVNAIRLIAESIASLFGFQLPKVDYSSVNQIANAADSTATSTGKTAKNTKKAAKEAKNLLASWDELNIILQEVNDSSSGSGSGSGGKGVGDQWTWDLPTYDFLAGLAESKVDAIFNKIRPIIDWIQEHIKGILETIALGASYFGLWQFSKSFLASLGEVLSLKSLIGGSALALGTIVVGLGLNWMFDSEYVKSGNIMDLIRGKFAAVFSSKIAGQLVGRMFGKVAGGVVTGATIMLSGAVDILVGAKHIEANGIDKETIYTQIAGAVSGAVGMFLTATALGATVGGGFLWALGALALYGAAAIIIDKVALAKYNQEQLKAKVDWGSVSLTQEEMKTLAESLLKVESSYTVNVSAAKTVASDLDAAYKTLKEYESKFSSESLMFKFGVDDETSLADMMMTLTGYDTGSWDGTFTSSSLLGSLSSVFSTNAKVISLGVSLLGFVDENGNTLNSEEVVRKITEGQNVVETTVETIGQKLGSLLSDGYKKGLDAEKDAMIQYYSDWLNDLAMSGENIDSIARFRTGVGKLNLTDLNRDSFAGTVEEYKKLKEQLLTEQTEIAEATQTALYARAAFAEVNYQHALEGLTKGYTTQAEVDKLKKVWEDALGLAETYDPVATATAAVNKITSDGEAIIKEAARQLYGTALDNLPEMYGDLPLAEAIAKIFAMNMRDKGGFELIDESEWGAELLGALNRVISGSIKKEDFDVLRNAVQGMGGTVFDMLPSELQENIFNAVKKYMNDDDAATLKLFKDMGSNYGTSMGNSMEQPSAFKEAGRKNAQAYLSAFSHLPGMTMSMPSLSLPTLFASGGFPTTGQMFIARESGAEMVGSIGRRTAVANNDQIVEGISSGVANGQSEQNSLLRQQNEYLAEIAAKDNSLALYPSVAMARVVNASQRMWQRTQGG